MPSRTPALQFYPADWRKDPGVQSLDYFDRGVWFELLMVMHESSERGKLVLNGRAMTEAEIAAILGLLDVCCSKTLANILAKGVAKVEQNSGKIYCKRMVDDEAANLAKVKRRQEILEKRREAGRKGGLAKAKQSSTLSSSSASTTDKNTPNGAAARPTFWDIGAAILERAGVPNSQGRSFLGQLVKEFGEDEVRHAVASLSGLKDVADPRAYLRGILKPKPKMVLA